MTKPYYDIGKATLTAGSDIMTGHGTLWLGNARPGDQAMSYSGHTAIVGEVVSNTQIKLTRPYRGTSQAAQVYEILYTPDDPFTQQEARSILAAISASALVKLGGVAPAARQLIRFDQSANASLSPISDYMLTLLAEANAQGARATLGANNAGNLNSGILPAARLPFVTGTSQLTFRTTVEPLSATYIDQACRYLRIGQLVVANIHLRGTITNPGTGAIFISGLPFAISPSSGRVSLARGLNTLCTEGVSFDAGGTEIRTLTALGGVANTSLLRTNIEGYLNASIVYATDAA